MAYETLIEPAALKSQLGAENWCIIDCRFSLADPEAGYREYLAAHIPGALYAHLDNDLSSPVRPGTGRHPLPERTTLQEKFGAWGIDSTTQVIVYDNSGGMMAARLWWLLRWMGHASVALLDGGLPRWQREGHPLTTALPVLTPRTFVPGPPLEQPVSSEELLSRLDDTDHLLIDVRAAERFRGEVEPLDRVAGHIPWAINLPLQNNLDGEGNFLPAAELQHYYANALGNRAPHHIAIMCGSGVTACHTLLALHLAGWHGAKLYAGSWSEWITDPSRPVAKTG